MSVDCQCVILDLTVFLYDVCSFLLFWCVICLSVSWWAGLIGLAVNWIWFCVFLWFSSWCQPVCIKSLCPLHQWVWCAFRSTGQMIWLLAWTLVTLPRMWQKPRTSADASWTQGETRRHKWSVTMQLALVLKLFSLHRFLFSLFFAAAISVLWTWHHFQRFEGNVCVMDVMSFKYDGCITLVLRM